MKQGLKPTDISRKMRIPVRCNNEYHLCPNVEEFIQEIRRNGYTDI